MSLLDARLFELDLFLFVFIVLLLLSVRTVHLQGVGRTDFSLWYSDIQRAAGGKGNTLREQQLSRNDIPIIVDSCIAFITQYGEEEKLYL